MWHVSASLQQFGRFLTDRARLERISVELLAGVGGIIEWWNPVGDMNPAVTHLRVPTTPDEQRMIPAGVVTMDAGDEGTLRPRTYPTSPAADQGSARPAKDGAK